MNVFAAEIDLGTIGGGKGLGPFGEIAGDLAGDNYLGLIKVTQAISSVIGVMTVAAAIWFILIFLTGGFYWMTSSGDKAKLHEARERISNALIGLIIVVASWSILALAGQFFGYDIVIKDPKAVIDQLFIR